MHDVQRRHGTPSRRRRSIEDRIDEVRDWILTCEECEHVGCVNLSLRRLRAVNLICSECGVPIKRRRQTTARASGPGSNRRLPGTYRAL